MQFHQSVLFHESQIALSLFYTTAENLDICLSEVSQCMKDSLGFWKVASLTKIRNF